MRASLWNHLFFAYRKITSKRKKDRTHQQLTAKIDEDAERKRVLHHRREASAMGNAATLTVPEWLSILEHFGHRCALTYSFDITMDHFFPQTIGGGTSKENVYPLDLRMNQSKNDANPIIWAAHQSDVQEALFDELLAYFAAQYNMTLDQFRRFVFWCFSERMVDVKKFRIADERSEITEQLLRYSAQELNLTIDGYLSFARYCISHHLRIEASHVQEWLASRQKEEHT